MVVTLERRSGRWSAVLVLVGAAGVLIAALAYLMPPLGTAPDAGAPGSAVSAEASAPPGSPSAPVQDGRIHVPLFVDPNAVRPTPRFRFTFDPPAALSALREEEGIDAVVDGAADDLSRCVRLMSWTRRQWEPGVPNPYPPLDARIILKDIRRGFTGGFFAQYNYVLAQGLQSIGIPARYVSVVEHEVIEARLPDVGWWVCLDPLYDTYYMDEAGKPLSVYEIHRSVKEGRPVTLSRRDLVSDAARHLDAFRSFAVWLKNDHISSPLNFTDLDRYKVYFLDKGTPAGAIPPGALSTTETVDLYPS